MWEEGAWGGGRNEGELRARGKRGGEEEGMKGNKGKGEDGMERKKEWRERKNGEKGWGGVSRA